LDIAEILHIALFNKIQAQDRPDQGERPVPARTSLASSCRPWQEIPHGCQERERRERIGRYHLPANFLQHDMCPHPQHGQTRQKGRLARPPAFGPKEADECHQECYKGKDLECPHNCPAFLTIVVYLGCDSSLCRKQLQENHKDDHPAQQHTVAEQDPPPELSPACRARQGPARGTFVPPHCAPGHQAALDRP
jgi:hypothetical protein